MECPKPMVMEGPTGVRGDTGESGDKGETGDMGEPSWCGVWTGEVAKEYGGIITWSGWCEESSSSCGGLARRHGAGRRPCSLRWCLVRVVLRQKLLDTHTNSIIF